MLSPQPPQIHSWLRLLGRRAREQPQDESWPSRQALEMACTTPAAAMEWANAASRLPENVMGFKWLLQMLQHCVWTSESGFYLKEQEKKKMCGMAVGTDQKIAPYVNHLVHHVRRWRSGAAVVEGSSSSSFFVSFWAPLVCLLLCWRGKITCMHYTHGPPRTREKESLIIPRRTNGIPVAFHGRNYSFFFILF